MNRQALDIRPGWMGMAVLIGCLGWTPARGAESPAEATVRQAMVEVVSAATRLDAEGILGRLDPDPACRYFVQGQSFRHAELALFLKGAFADMKGQDVVWLESAARELAPGVVLWTSSGRNPVVEANGREVEYLLAETWVWKLAGDTWRAVHYQESFLEMPSREKRARVESALAEVAAGLKVDSRDPNRILPALETFVQAREDVAGASFAFAPQGGEDATFPRVFRKGGEIVRQLRPSSSEYTRSEWYARSVASGSPSWSEPYFDSQGDEAMKITCGVPIFDPPGVLQGVLTADVTFY